MNKIYLFILLLLYLAFSLLHLGKWAFLDFDEAIYAEVYRESAIHNNYFTFTYLNQPWFDKPPLYFWLAKISATFFDINEFSLRFPSTILVVCSILFVYLIVVELSKDRVAALLSAIILATTAYFLYSGRQLRLDVPVASAILFSFYAFLKARARPIWFLVFGLIVACGILFKSVIGMLVYPILLLYSWVYKDKRWLTNKWFWIGNILTLALIIPWHLYQSSLYGKKFWDYYIGLEVLDRVTQTVAFGEKSPFLLHLQQLVIVTQPWFLVFMISSFVFLISQRKKIKNFQFELFALLTTVIIFLIFYIPQTRLLYYFIPMLSFMSMFIGSIIARLLKVWSIRTLIVFTLLVMIGFTHTILRIQSSADRNFFLQKSSKMSRQTIANEEKAVAEIAGDEKLPLYLYNWEFYPTLVYYNVVFGGVNLQKVTKGDTLEPPFLLLIPTPLFKGVLPVRTSLKTASELLYKGQAATLIKVF